MASSGTIVEALSAGVGFQRSSVAVCLRVLRGEGQIRTGARGLNAYDLTTTEVVRLLIGVTSPLAVDAGDAVRAYEPLGLSEPPVDVSNLMMRPPESDMRKRRTAKRSLREYAAARSPLSSLGPGDTFGGALELLLAAYVDGVHAPSMSGGDLDEKSGPFSDGSYEPTVVIRLLRPVPAAIIDYSWRSTGDDERAGASVFRRSYRFGEAPSTDEGDYLRLVRERTRTQHWGSQFFLNQHTFEVLAAAMRMPRAPQRRVGRERRGLRSAYSPAK